MDTMRRFDSKVGAELWLEREGVEGQPVLLDMLIARPTGR